jgi:hypothetical protein
MVMPRAQIGLQTTVVEAMPIAGGNYRILHGLILGKWMLCVRVTSWIAVDRGQIMTMRAAAVAGYFYDANASRLQHHVNQLLSADSANVKSAIPEALPEALIVPHAGYIYSGSTAAYAFRCLLTDPDQVNRVLMISELGMSDSNQNSHEESVADGVR